MHLFLIELADDLRDFAFSKRERSPLAHRLLGSLANWLDPRFA